MKYRGIVYDVGLKFSEPSFSVDPFDPRLVEHDMNTIANELHANAVRIEGEEIHRLETASKAAHAVGLSVFFNPWKMNATIEECTAYYAEAAKTAEKLRLAGIDIVFVTGCEYTIFNQGVFPGTTFNDRGAWMVSNIGIPGEEPVGTLAFIAENAADLNRVLAGFVRAVRPSFKGPVTYSAGSWEKVDWSVFDIVGIDHYRRGESEEKYLAGLDHHRIGKPLVVMEVGSCAYEGAAALGDGGFALLQGTNPDGTGIFKDGVVPKRSEQEQGDYMSTQLRLLSGAGVEGVFTYVFSFPCMPLGDGNTDMDMMSYSLVKTFPKSDPRSNGMPPWAPKEAFKRVAELYRQVSQSSQAN